MAVTDGNGIPLAVHVASASPAEVKLVEDTLHARFLEWFPDRLIGDRAYDSDPAIVAALGGAVCDGLRAAGVMPVIKHLPGHGRAMVDSHFHLPTLDESAEVLTETDLAPFRRVGGPAHADRCWAMTAHIVCRAFDADAPVTLSQRAIARVIRGAIGFEGVLLSDDVSMQALQGTLGARTAGALAAGCDLVLHCNGKMDEMRQVAAEAPELSGDALQRAERALHARRKPSALDVEAARREFAAMIDGYVA